MGASGSRSKIRELNPPESARSYSSIKDFRDHYSAAGHHDSRLGSRTGWTPARHELHGEPWVQIDAGEVVSLHGVVVQSWRGWQVHGVSVVRVETSRDGRGWTRSDDGRTWDTRRRWNGRNACRFAYGAVLCRHVRVVGVDYSDRGGDGTHRGHGPSMRCGLLVGPAPSPAAEHARSGAIAVHVHDLSGTSYRVHVDPTDSVDSLKLKLDHASGLDWRRMRLFAEGERPIESGSMAENEIAADRRLKVVQVTEEADEAPPPDGAPPVSDSRS